MPAPNCIVGQTATCEPREAKRYVSPLCKGDALAKQTHGEHCRQHRLLAADQGRNAHGTSPIYRPIDTHQREALQTGARPQQAGDVGMGARSFGAQS